MSTYLQLALIAFMLAMVHAAVLETWRRNLQRRSGNGAGTSSTEPTTRVSMIVPVRNGEATIVPLLQDLHAQRYPKEWCEVIVVDDHSEDATAAMVNGLMRTWPQLRCLKAEGHGKKAAIATGARAAKGGVLLLTDADMRCGPERLPAMVEAWQRTTQALLLMPVRLAAGSTALDRLQAEEHLALQGATAGSGLEGRPVLANGANMAFAKDAFDRVGGYTGDRWASGDDLFLMRRMQRAGLPVAYLADRRTIVTGVPERTWAGFWAQRSRWAGKMRALLGSRGMWLGAFAVLFPWGLGLLTYLVVRNVQVGQQLFYTASLLTAAWLAWSFPIFRLVRTTERFLAVEGHASATPHERLGIRATLVTCVALLVFALYAPVLSLLSFFFRPAWKGRRT